MLMGSFLNIVRAGLSAAMIATLFGMGTTFAGAQGGKPATQLVEPPAPLLPASAPFIANPDAAAFGNAEAAAVLKEDGLKREESRLVSSSTQNAPASGVVTAYEFGDATGAYAAYTYLRHGGKAVAHGVNPTDAQQPGGGSVFLSSTSVVVASPKLPSDLLKQVEAGLPKIAGRRGLAPLLPTLIPPASLDAATIRYALGPVGYAAMGGVLKADDLGWDKSTEVATADYHGGKGKFTLLLYPTPQIAGDRGRAIQNDVNAAGPATFGTIKMRRLGPLVGVTSGALSDAQAIDLVSALKLNEEVTFDKKMPLEFHAEVRKTYSLLQTISVFCGISILAAVVLAIFFGGARAGIRVLQGKPAASEPEFLRIDLRGKPDALNASNSNPPGATGPHQ